MIFFFCKKRIFLVKLRLILLRKMLKANVFGPLGQANRLVYLFSFLLIFPGILSAIFTTLMAGF